MTEQNIREILTRVRKGSLSIDKGLEKLKHLPFEDVGFARIDHHRAIRQGFPEVVFGRGKTVHQIRAIVERMLAHEQNILITRSSAEVFRAVRKLERQAQFYPDSGAILIHRDKTQHGKGKILIACAGTADIPVAEEALVTADAMGNTVENLYDVGVAGIHRILSERARLAEARVIVVVAGMEGALPSVVGGLVSVPVIAVPTSIGYGASLNGIAALLGMLNSCSSNVTVVNIDNGFGAGYVASLINRL
ncbi:MAG: nickel pincer cofactor biosynthesis protein LarB [Acidobacteria bacterium]|nr:nickel pincer cofactor biosynthesis protein LarB [Acidobacteriota bacterium]MCI0622828.1 nickel pincer cofactor biosynthesis protein LarB [Acidobacteriota bacterium]MCI0719735.1 nickel pincer cofactor biosynthesis protein LarB [Acidobacteriota bacterium]